MVKVLTRQEAIDKLVENDMDTIHSEHQQGDDSYVAALLEYGHKGYADYSNEELASELKERFDTSLFEVIDDYDLYCEECGWIGNEDELKTVMSGNENNPQDKTLYESKVCPECEKNNFSK
jgi:hypothetical protein